MNLNDLLDRSKAIAFATVDDLARLPRGRAAGTPAEPTEPVAPDDGQAILAALGDGPLPPGVSIVKGAPKPERERNGQRRSRRVRRARRARGLPR